MAFEDPTGTDHDYLGGGLRKAIYNYMHGVGLDVDVREWFEPRADGVQAAAQGAELVVGAGQRAAPRLTAGVPRTTVPPDLIEQFLS